MIFYSFCWWCRIKSCFHKICRILQWDWHFDCTPRGSQRQFRLILAQMPRFRTWNEPLIKLMATKTSYRTLDFFNYTPWSYSQFFKMKVLTQPGAIIEQSSLSWCYTQYCNGGSRTCITSWAHKRHHISHPLGRDMGCPLWEFWRKNDGVITTAHCPLKWTT